MKTSTDSSRPSVNDVSARAITALSWLWKGLAVGGAAAVLLVLADGGPAAVMDARLASQEKKPETAAAAPEVLKAEDKLLAPVLGLDFTKLSFPATHKVVDLKTGQPRYLAEVPDLIKSYDGRRVRIRGYLMPVKTEGNEVREFLIMANQMACCYGSDPRFWEFIVAKKTGDAVPNWMDTPLTFEGVLKVGDVYENGYWTQFYTMEVTSVIK